MEEQTAEIVRQKQDGAGRIGFIGEGLDDLEQADIKRGKKGKRIDGGIGRNGEVVAADSVIIYLKRFRLERRHAFENLRLDNLGDSFSASQFPSLFLLRCCDCLLVQHFLR